MLGLVLVLACLAVMAVDLVLSHVSPRMLRGFARIPFGSAREVLVHPSHLVGDKPANKPPSYRESADARPAAIEIVPFAEHVTDEDARLVPLEDGMGAMLVSTSAMGRAEATMRIDATIGPERDRVVLRARVTPAIVVTSVFLPVIILALAGPRSVVAAVVLGLAGWRSYSATRRALDWALNLTELRLTTRRDGAPIAPEDVARLMALFEAKTKKAKKKKKNRPRIDVAAEPVEDAGHPGEDAEPDPPVEPSAKDGSA